MVDYINHGSLTKKLCLPSVDRAGVGGCEGGGEGGGVPASAVEKEDASRL